MPCRKCFEELQIDGYFSRMSIMGGIHVMVRFQISEDDFNNSSCPHSIAMRNPKFPYVESAFLSIIVNSVRLTTYHHISSGFILFFHFQSNDDEMCGLDSNNHEPALPSNFPIVQGMRQFKYKWIMIPIGMSNRICFVNQHLGFPGHQNFVHTLFCSHEFLFALKTRMAALDTNVHAKNAQIPLPNQNPVQKRHSFSNLEPIKVGNVLKILYNCPMHQFDLKRRG